MTSPLIAICSACGALRTSGANCAHCGSAQGGVNVSQRADDAVWVCIECTFKCRMCGFRVPLNRLDMDGEVICARCSLEQAFDVQQWQTVFEEAHAVADLWGDRGRELEQHLDNQYAFLGKQNASMVFNGAGENAVNVMASPGAPLCENCKAPLDLKLDDDAKRSGRTNITCACGATSSYEVPSAARLMGPILSVIGSEHRTDRRDVKVDATESAISVRCPGCNAPLPANADTKFVTCSYCHVQARIPDRTWFKISKKEHVAEPIWLLFKNPSKSRLGVTELKRQFDEKNAELDVLRAHRHEQQVLEAKAAEERRLEYAAKEKRRQEEKLQDEVDRAKRLSDKAASERLSTLLGFGAAGAFGIFLLVVMFLNKKDEDAKRAAEAKQALECDPQSIDACMAEAAKSLESENYAKAIDDYETACFVGSEAACNAGDALCQQSVMSMSDRVTHFEKRCKHGDSESCNAAGLLYVNATGNGLAKDESAASTLFKRACDSGNTTGCKLLAQSCARVVSESCPVGHDAGADARHKAAPKH